MDDLSDPRRLPALPPRLQRDATVRVCDTTPPGLGMTELIGAEGVITAEPYNPDRPRYQVQFTGVYPDGTATYLLWPDEMVPLDRPLRARPLPGQLPLPWPFGPARRPPGDVI